MIRIKKLSQDQIKADNFEKDYSSFEGKDAKSEGVVPSPVSLVPEEKVSFGLYALSVSALTVARIRKVYNKLDSKAIAKQVSRMISQWAAANTPCKGVPELSLAPPKQEWLLKTAFFIYYFGLFCFGFKPQHFQPFSVIWKGENFLPSVQFIFLYFHWQLRN